MFPCLCIWLRLQGQFGSVNFGLHVIHILINAPVYNLKNLPINAPWIQLHTALEIKIHLNKISISSIETMSMVYY